MLEAAGRVGQLVLEIKVDAGRGEARQVDAYEMRVGGAVEVGFNQADGVRHPIAVDRRGAAVARFSAAARQESIGDGRVIAVSIERSGRPVHAVAHGVEDVRANVVDPL